MGAPLCCSKARMPYQLVNGAGINPALGQASGEGVAKIVKPKILDLSFRESILKSESQGMDIDLSPES